MVVCVEYCLFCDVCGENWADGGNGCFRPMERRRKAEEDGWIHTGHGASLRDLCPECAKEEVVSQCDPV